MESESFTVDIIETPEGLMKERYNKAIHLYDDGIGKVEYVDHMGTDLTIVNSARLFLLQRRHEQN